MSSSSFCPRTGLGRLVFVSVVAVVVELDDTTQQTLSLFGPHVRWRVGGRGAVEVAAAEEEAGGAAEAREVDRRRRKRIEVSARRCMASEGELTGNLGTGVGTVSYTHLTLPTNREV